MGVPLPDAERDALALLGGFFLQQGQAERALTVFAGLEALEPQVMSHARLVAVAALAAGRPERALIALDRIALGGQIDDVFHLARAEALSAVGRAAEASASMRAWLSLREAAQSPVGLAA
jgi:tetratricopeptide (TPR) repeat protein